MKTKTDKKFDSVEFFRAIKEKMAKKMTGMTLKEQKKFLKLVKEGKADLA